VDSGRAAPKHSNEPIPMPTTTIKWAQLDGSILDFIRHQSLQDKPVQPPKPHRLAAGTTQPLPNKVKQLYI